MNVVRSPDDRGRDAGSGDWNRPLGFTRFVLWFDCVGLLLLGGLGLNVFADDTETYFAWTIAVPMSAAFLGVGYWAAFPSALWATRIPAWDRVRIVPVTGLVLTFFIMFASFRDLSLFHFGEGGAIAHVQAWIWILGYLALPPLNGLAWYLQDRAARGHRAPSEGPLLPFTRAVLVVHAVASVALGTLLLFAVGIVDDLWPWPLTRLAAGAMGAWLFALAAAMGWALAHPDWRSLRLLGPFFPLYFAGQLISLIRFRGDLVGGARTSVYVGVLAASLVAFIAVAWVQERARRALPAPAAAA